MMLSMALLYMTGSAVAAVDIHIDCDKPTVPISPVN
jgi:hypothetical protein